MHPLSVNYVELSLKSRRRSGMYLSLAALVTLLGSAEAIKIAAVTALGKSGDVTAVQKAIALDPGNPVLHNQLTELYSDSPEQSSLAAALQGARRATALNPNKSDYWLTLASTCESVPDNACADQALQRVLNLSPMVPQVWWVAGNHYLRTDRRESALPCFHRLLELSPEYAAPTFALTLRAYGEPKMIFDKVVGNEKNPQLGLAFADFMSANNQFDAARQAWTQIASKGSQFPFAAVQPYIERLLGQGRYQEAQTIWSQLEMRGVIAKPGDSEPGNLLFNGGFEQPPLGAGFDWRSQPSSYVSADFADASPYAGAHCLRVDFPVGQNDEFEPVYQIVPVVPNQAYTLAAYVRSRDITSDSGPRLRVTDPACPSCLDALTDTTVGSTSWHKVTLKFNAGPITQAVRISVWRPRSRVFPMEISGSFWLDAVSIRAEAE
jgi:tetratricopeptide (TPR) repeat protein